MKRVLLGVLILCFMNGCARTDAPITNNIVESAKNTLESIKSTLPSECRTESINAQIIALETQINNIPEICQSEIEPIKAQRDNYKLKLQMSVVALGILLMLMFRGK